LRTCSCTHGVLVCLLLREHMQRHTIVSALLPFEEQAYAFTNATLQQQHTQCVLAFRSASGHGLTHMQRDTSSSALLAVKELARCSRTCSGTCLVPALLQAGICSRTCCSTHACLCGFRSNSVSVLEHMQQHAPCVCSASGRRIGMCRRTRRDTHCTFARLPLRERACACASGIPAPQHILCYASVRPLV
jgi:hypothetical protein